MELKRGNRNGYYRLHPLLIVPYGIETESLDKLSITFSTFNRTLWN